MSPGNLQLQSVMPHLGRVLKVDQSRGIGYVAEIESPDETIGVAMEKAETTRPFVFSLRDVVIPSGANAQDFHIVDGATVSFACDNLGRIIGLAVIDD
jgi:hypothetical protein